LSMGLLKEFKNFAMRGNVMDMAVGIIIGGAFGKIVASLVSDVLMPPLGKLIGNVNFTDLVLVVGEGDKGATIKYGSFLQTVIDFAIVAFAVFMMIKAMNKATVIVRKEEVPTALTMKECPKCCSTIPIKATRCPQCTSEI
jgi:large conductance mechanosensitive channel